MTEEQKILQDGRAALKVLEGMDDDHLLYVPARVLKKTLRYMLGNAWKDVRDELPEHDAPCLICADGVYTPLPAKYTEWGWICPMAHVEPTHWMPMPEPPQRDEQLDLFQEAAP